MSAHDTPPTLTDVFGVTSPAANTTGFERPFIAHEAGPEPPVTAASRAPRMSNPEDDKKPAAEESVYVNGVPMVAVRGTDAFDKFRCVHAVEKRQCKRTHDTGHDLFCSQHAKKPWCVYVGRPEDKDPPFFVAPRPPAAVAVPRATPIAPLNLDDMIDGIANLVLCTRDPLVRSQLATAMKAVTEAGQQIDAMAHTPGCSEDVALCVRPR